MYRLLLLIALGCVTIAGCTKTERKVPQPINRSAYWHPALGGELVVPCVPDDTREITPDMPTIFRSKCPKGWHQTMIYYKGLSEPQPK